MERRFYPLGPLFEAVERKGKSAIGAFNVNFYAQALGIIEGLIRADAPGIIQASRGANKFQGGPGKIIEVIYNAMEKARGNVPPICVHLDHGDRESAIKAMDAGYSSVMVDYSTKKIIENGKERKIKTPLWENVEKTKEVVIEAGKRGVSIEGEIGVLAGQEEDVQSEVSIYPTAQEVFDYAESTGIDAIAIACGTCHGPVKKFIRLEEELLMKTEELFKNNWRIPRFVLHGSSTIPKEMVREFIESGGLIENASGVPMEAIKKSMEYGVRKINIDTDLRLGITTTIRRYFLKNPDVDKESEVMNLIKKGLDSNRKAIDPRDYLGEVMILYPEYLRNDYWTTGDYKYGEMMHYVKEKIASHVEKLVKEFGSAGLAGKVRK